MSHAEMASTMSAKTILIVDDDRDVGEILQKVILEQTDYRAMWIAESDLVLFAAPHLRPALILLDYKLPAMHGLDLYDRLQEIETMKGVPTILISAWEKLPFDELHARGIYVLKKPFELDDLLDMLAQLLPQEQA
ncbi:MAG: response regulator [Chloroflexota bacterium]|nr:response regulator [Chloroflexota bacterium]